MSLGTILLIILVVILLGGFSGLGGGPFYGTGYYGGGGLGLWRYPVILFVAESADRRIPPLLKCGAWGDERKRLTRNSARCVEG